MDSNKVILSKEQFSEAIVNRINKEQEFNAKVDFVVKNNDIKILSIMIHDSSDSGIGVHVDMLYKYYTAGATIDDAIMIIKEAYNNNHPVQTSLVYDKTKAFLRLINEDMNKERLKDIPYFKFNDLAVICSYKIAESEEGLASYIVNNELLKTFGISKDELFMDAYNNISRKDFCVKSMAEVMAEITGDFFYEIVGELLPMIVVKANNGLNGATALLYKDIIKEIALKHNDDIFIIPSSIHEIILVPCSECGNDAQAIAGMVQDVNNTEVRDDEILSYNVYKYSLQENEITIA